MNEKARTDRQRILGWLLSLVPSMLLVRAGHALLSIWVTVTAMIGIVLTADSSEPPLVRGAARVVVGLALSAAAGVLILAIT